MKKENAKDLDFSKMQFTDGDTGYYFGDDEILDEGELGVVLTADEGEMDDPEYQPEDVALFGKDWRDEMITGDCGMEEASFVLAGMIPARFHKNKKEKKMRMRPKSVEARREFVRKNKFYTLAYGKYGKVRVV